MLNRNINILGTIGVGKTTLLEAIKKQLDDKGYSTLKKAEPSVTIPFINNVLEKFYNDNSAWSYPLQLCITAAQEAYLQDLSESEYDYALCDMVFSSDIYSYSHAKNGRMSLEKHNTLVNLSTPFKFDYLILIDETAEATIERVKARNKQAYEGDLDPDKLDVSIDDFSYIYSHIADFKEYLPIWINKFKLYNPNIKIINIVHIPEKGTLDYEHLIRNIVDQITEN